MSTHTRKICVVTGTRAEYGLLRWVMKGIQDSELLDLQLIVTGTHLSPEFGRTVEEIETDGFPIDHKVEMLLSSDTPVGITKSMGLAMIGFADSFEALQPDIVLLLGDRFEILAAASAALVALIPIAHCHGGELTEGAFDDAIRHSITKMASLHFVATEVYRNRVIQLGESPTTVHWVGGLGVDAIKHIRLLTRDELESSLDFKLGDRNLLVTFHPPTLDGNSGLSQLEELLYSLDHLTDTHLLFTMPNCDTDGRSLITRLNIFCRSHPNAKLIASLGQQRYFSCIKHFDGVVGNSSSGLLEVPSFNKGTVNIGDRQKGRLKAASVIDCLPNRQSISEALIKLEIVNNSSNNQQIFDNPYERSNSSESIVSILENAQFLSTQKQFHDINFPV